MKFSKVIYFLLLGIIIAILALLIVFDQSDTEEKKEVIVPLVKEVVDAKPIEIKPSRKQTAETIELEVIRVRPDGSLVIAGKGLPNSKVEVISGAKVIAVTTSDKIGDFVAVPEQLLKGGEYLLSFRQTTEDKKVIIANKSVAVKVTGQKDDIPVVAILDSEGKFGAKVVQAPGLNVKNDINSQKEKIFLEDKREPYIAILAITHDTKVGQLVLSGQAHNGVQINAGFTGKQTSSTKIKNDEWTLSIPGKLITGKQKIFAVLLGKNGKVLKENSIIISGKSIQNANGKTFVVVQKGDALWNIAYQRLGLGTRYVDIVKLNKNTIVNPDLIYPKQLFIIPNKNIN